MQAVLEEINDRAATGRARAANASAAPWVVDAAAARHAELDLADRACGRSCVRLSITGISDAWISDAWVSDAWPGSYGLFGSRVESAAGAQTRCDCAATPGPLGNP